ncbi:alpha/beta hydrolase [Rahnella sp. SAP-1]|uniref:Alpha/beta hydrolase n=1 Tax=Rouxiella aceris TaxID=2703884 RepID=A0A848MPK0_9GAMM|nr:alpha/beta hydrolase [Rouxiella aceris]NMP28940.1 alpha/beta hydrolase [Rouxiella aceris]
MTPVVFVPGLLCSAEVFAPQVAALWPFGPITIASTLQGESIPEMATAILATAPARFALVGISMGGYISLEIMRQAPERVIKLALLNTSARADTLEQTTLRRTLIAHAKSTEFASLLIKTLGSILHPSRHDDSALREINVRMGLTVGLEGFIRQSEAIIARENRLSELPKIKVPTLVLVGDSDPMTPPICSEEMANAIPNARLVIVEHCGHASTLEQPGAVNHELIKWMQQPLSAVPEPLLFDI